MPNELATWASDIQGVLARKSFLPFWASACFIQWSSRKFCSVFIIGMLFILFSIFTILKLAVKRLQCFCWGKDCSGQCPESQNYFRTFWEKFRTMIEIYKSFSCRCQTLSWLGQNFQDIFQKSRRMAYGLAGKRTLINTM